MQDSTVVGSVGDLVAVDIELFPRVPSEAERAIGVTATRSRFIGKLENVKCWRGFMSTSEGSWNYSMSYRSADKTCHAH